MRYHKWYQITIRIDESHQDDFIGRLTALNFSGFSQENDFLKCYIPAERWTRETINIFRLLLKNVKTGIRSLNLNYSIALINERNWNKDWEKHTGIVEATSKIIIKPSWKKVTKRYKNRLVLQIDPKMSFGTGHHETTRLSLYLIERFMKPDMSVLDIGCGTGILGIACARLGAREVLAIDNDEWAVQNSIENVKRNRVNKKMRVLSGSIDVVPKKKFDLIAANLDYNTIKQLISPISSKAQKNGTLIVSGILTTDVTSLLKILRRNSLVPIEIDSENEWTSIALCRI